MQDLTPAELNRFVEEQRFNAHCKRFHPIKSVEQYGEYDIHVYFEVDPVQGRIPTGQYSYLSSLWLDSSCRSNSRIHAGLRSLYFKRRNCTSVPNGCTPAGTHGYILPAHDFWPVIVKPYLANPRTFEYPDNLHVVSLP